MSTVSDSIQEQAKFPVRAGVVGWPITHSRSPIIHNYWLAKYGISARYDKFPVAPGKFLEFARSMPEKGLLGCNVTIPLKTEAFSAAEVRHPDAAATGAANTIWFEGGKIHATNTDIEGFMQSLNRGAPDWRRRDLPVVVLGAGGAARGIIYGLLKAGVGRIHLLNRTRKNAERQQAELGPHRIEVFDWTECAKALRGAGTLVNTTALGMTGKPPLEIDLTALGGEATVVDIVYAPLETELLASARRLGHTPVDGLGMLLYQAAPAFERWFGVRPEVTPELRSMVEADLEAR